MHSYQIHRSVVGANVHGIPGTPLAIAAEKAIYL